MTLRDHLGPRTPENAALHDELDRLLAARAVALDEAAKLSDFAHIRYVAMRGRDPQDYTTEHSRRAEAIRALADTDSTAALDRVIRAHVEKALEMARKVGDVVEHTDRPNWANEGAWAHCTEVYTMRIVAITADDVLREMGGRGNG